MPKYRITDPATQRTIEIDGPNPPSEALVRQMFAQLPAKAATTPAMPPPDQGGDVLVDNLKNIGQLAVKSLPAIGGAVGGIVGGIGGTVGGMGVGGVPGAIGGAAVGGAGGEAAKQLINRMIGTPAPSTPMQAAADIGVQGAVQGGAQAAGSAIGAAMRPMGAALMQSAVKPGIKATANALFKGVATEDLPVVKTLLKEGVNVTPGGIAKLDRIISASNDEIRQALASIPADVRINPEAVAARTADTAARFTNQVDNQADLNAIQNTAKRFLEQHSTQAPVGVKQVPTGILDASGQMITKEAPVMGAVPEPIPPLQAQAEKVGTYQQLKAKAYGELKAPEIEAQKALARGLKEEIESEAAKMGTDISAPNMREGAAITAKEAVARRLAVAGNRDPASLAWLAHNPTAGLLFLMERSPVVKSLLARGLWSSAGAATGVSPQLIRLMAQSVMTAPDQQPAPTEGTSR